MLCVSILLVVFLWSSLMFVLIWFGIQNYVIISQQLPNDLIPTSSTTAATTASRLFMSVTTCYGFSSMYLGIRLMLFRSNSIILQHRSSQNVTFKLQQNTFVIQKVFPKTSFFSLLTACVSAPPASPSSSLLYTASHLKKEELLQLETSIIN